MRQCLRAILIACAVMLGAIHSPALAQQTGRVAAAADGAGVVDTGDVAANAGGAGALEYTLGAGDKVEVTVFGHEDLSGTFEVDGAGRIGLPLIGQIMVYGMTAGQAEIAIRQQLQPDYLKNPRVSVQVLNYRPFYIIGEVKNPGSYPYVNGLTVVQAVALAGGFTYRAKEKKILVQRASDVSRGKRIVRQTDPVLPGDIIEVPERFF